MDTARLSDAGLGRHVAFVGEVQIGVLSQVTHGGGCHESFARPSLLAHNIEVLADLTATPASIETGQ
ncbi:hypothetical protein GOSPT_129_00420 [Gordonia sputi NBRC 100414]|uniref:Uncharacterized protein n=1 Tax=Gordonia sputi NBRC 100414 TaxID=1089453 RepID=H5U6N7_9ACTN|nr:hypothetical protein A5777_13675 [Gordonia sp. 852002-10350_SCH5691597]GAB41395.1 hypothetical protein GOSPT_129_00420 [Gordonia sputi NBRC 100414]